VDVRNVIATGVLALALCPACERGGAAARRPNVVLVTLDTTRADHLSCYGYGRETSPNLDALARAGVLYTRAVSTSSWTLPAHASLFTGKLTTSHGARYDAEGPLSLSDGIGGDWDHYRARGLAEGETTLAGLLAAEGYATAAVVAGPWMKAVFGLAEGFQSYDDDGIDELVGRRARQVTKAALEWLDGLAPERPFFLFLNYYDAHSPYGAPPPFTYAFFDEPPSVAPAPDDRATWPDLYDGEIRFADEQLGRLFAELERRGLWQDTLVVVTADHGELFGEHGGLYGHGKYLFEEEVHVPLVVKHPARDGEAPAREDARVQLVDVFALILGRVGIELPADAQGGLPPHVGHPIVAEVYPPPVISSDGDWRVVYDGDQKLHWSSQGRSMLFDLATDPREQRDLALSEPGRVAYLSDLLSAYLASLPRPGVARPGRLDAGTLRALEALGYVK
jgi:arylsulfatase A-like enzyme